MIFAIDIGNTNIKMAGFEGDKMVVSFRVASKAQTSDEYALSTKILLKNSGFSEQAVKGAIIASVNPALNYTFLHMCKFVFGIEPIIVDGTLKTGLNNLYVKPEEMGADRICACAAAAHIYGTPSIVVDYGTATVFNAIDKDKNLLGGAIFAGIKTTLDALIEKTAKLPNIELDFPKSIIGTDTRSNMQSGLCHGFAGLTHYFVDKFRQIDGMQNAKVIACGGLYDVIKDGISCVDIFDSALTLKGLNLLYQLNK